MTNTIDITIPYNFTPRDYQIHVYDAISSGKYSRAVALWHRRSGKDVTALNLTIQKMVEDIGVYFYVFPTYNQARKVIWDSVTNSGQRLLDYFPKDLIETINNSEMKIRFKNSSLFQLVGSDNYDLLMGTNPKGVVFSEYALQNPKAWEYVKPILTANKGWALFISTPRGKNHFYDLWQMALQNDTWFTQKITIDDSRFISKEDVEKDIKEGMCPETASQEYFCFFDVGIEGTYYGRLIDECRRDNRICKVPYDTACRVDTYWDLGFGDSTSVLFVQELGKELRIFDYYENSGEGMSHYAKMLQEKNYVYGTHFAPHDIEAGQLSIGRSLKTYAKEIGLNFKTVPKTEIEYGIECARSIFPYLWIDEKKCNRLIKCLENYHKRFNEKMNCYSNTPVHDENSHACFVENTLVSTSKGYKKIQDIQIDDYVITPLGKQKVIGLHRKQVKDLISVFTENSYVVCTPEHQFFCSEGLVNANALVYNSLIFSIGHKICSTSRCNKGYSGFREIFLSTKMKQSLFSTGMSTDGKATTTEEDGHQKTLIQLFKEQFSRSIMESSILKVTFITLIKMPKIMISKIWNVLHIPSIHQNTCQKKEKEFQDIMYSKQWNMRKSGMFHQRAESGIENTQKKQVLENSNFLKYVLSAAKNIMERFIIKNFVRIHVKQKTEFCQKKMTLQEIVHSADLNLNVINTLKDQHVVNIVQLKRQREPITVYDLEIENDHCYYANGLLVSNCDAFRYLAVSKRHGYSRKDRLTPEQIRDMRNKYI